MNAKRNGAVSGIARAGLAALSMASAAAAADLFRYEDPAEYPLMGDWAGRWIDPPGGHERSHPGMGAQLLPVNGGSHYRVLILPELYNRAEPYLDVVVPATHREVVVREGGFDVVFSGTAVRGKGRLRTREVEFELVKQEFAPPTIGLKPPEGAKVLFDGASFDAWRHSGNRNPVMWARVGDAMQIVRDKAKGGSIETVEAFGSLQFHMEFRYPVESDKSGQGRGNSGLYFLPIGEVQILNSYTTPGYWNEAGSIYKRVPAKVNAAGPPLAWQTYDVELDLPGEGGGTAILTVRLNGRLIHNKLDLPCPNPKVSILLQDHTNPIQFRNIWLVER